MRYRTTLSACFAFVFIFVAGHHAGAGPDAIKLRLPGQFFNKNTIAVAQVNVENVSTAQVIATLKAILPAEFAADVDKPETQQQMAAVDAFAGQFKALGIKRVHAVAVAKNPQNMDEVAGYILLPIDTTLTGDKKKEWLTQIQQLAGGFGGKAELLGAWAVVHQEEKLPVANDLDLGAYDAPFYEALRVNPDHDLTVAFVPTQVMRQMAVANWKQQLAQAKPDERAMAEGLTPVVNSEWIYLSVKLGSRPELRLSTNLGDEAKAQSVVSSWTQLLNLADQELRKQMAKEKQAAIDKANKDGTTIDEKKYDPQPLSKMLKALEPTQSGPRTVMHLDQAKLKDVTNGVVVVMQSIGAAIGEAIAESIVGGGDSEQPK